MTRRGTSVSEYFLGALRLRGDSAFQAWNTVDDLLIVRSPR